MLSCHSPGRHLQGEKKTSSLIIHPLFDNHKVMMAHIEEPPAKQAKVNHTQEPRNVFNFNVSRTPVATEAEFRRIYEHDFQSFDPQFDPQFYVPNPLQIPDIPQMVESQSWPTAAAGQLWPLGTKRGVLLFLDRERFRRD